MMGRILKAAFCGASGGTLLLTAVAVFKILIKTESSLLGGHEKLPHITKSFAGLIAQNETLLFCGVILLAIGYAWLIWFDSPSLGQCVWHGLIVFAFWLLLMCAFPLIQVKSGAVELPQGYTPPPLFSLQRDWPWFAICCTPLFLAILTWRAKSRHLSNSNSTTNSK